ncbi:hypothetical protein B0H13DRAFT_2339612 [Mycena leptocephala]|nr:hypothetical protein B0H13DRAFT_2339612 [Mycena leptocephala]
MRSIGMFSCSDHHHDCPLQVPTPLSTTPPPETQPIPHSDRVRAHHQRLETLLESALATLALIQDADCPVAYTLHALESASTPAAASSSTSASTPVPLTTTGTKTYAQAAASRPSSPPLPDSDPARPDIKAIPGRKLIAGVRWTRNGNLIIQVEQDAASASMLIETHKDIIWRAIKPILRISDTHPPLSSGCSCYTLPLVQESLRTGGFDHVVKAIALLCSDEELRHRIDGGIPVSMRVSVPTAAAAQQLINTGGTIIGGRYHATHYIPKPRTAEQHPNSTASATDK